MSNKKVSLCKIETVETSKTDLEKSPTKPSLQFSNMDCKSPLNTKTSQTNPIKLLQTPNASLNHNIAVAPSTPLSPKTVSNANLCTTAEKRGKIKFESLVKNFNS